MGVNNPRMRKAEEAKGRKPVASERHEDAPLVQAGEAEERKPAISGQISALAADNSGSFSAEIAEIPSEDTHVEEPAPSTPAGPISERQLQRAQKAEKKKRRKRRRRAVKWVLFSLGFLLFAAVVAVVVVYCMFRWETFDDVQSIQGQWRFQGSDLPVTITEDQIVLTDEVAYDYVLDPHAKTIEFSFGNMKGSGHYRFSMDRQELSIMDGNFDWWDTFTDDGLWTIHAVLAQLKQEPSLSPAGEEDVTNLIRVPEAVESATEQLEMPADDL